MPDATIHASHVVEDQEAAFRLLGDPATHGGAPVTRIDTHGAVVFLAGADAYKVKRAVRFPFMDFSTLDKRRIACADEVAINAPQAPDLYLGVVALTHAADGGLTLGGAGDAVEYAVHMRRFDETMTLDRVADRGALSDAVLVRLVDKILAAHGYAPTRSGETATDGLARYLVQNREAFAEWPDVFPPPRAEALATRCETAFRAIEPLLRRRGRRGLVRRCHGDLHLRNVVLIEDEPTLFDAIEFDEAIATCDVLYDLAFLLMDLWGRDLRRQANLVLNRVMQETPTADRDGLAALPFFMALRAIIRAKVTAGGLPSLAGQAHDAALAQARRAFMLAEAILKPEPTWLIAVGGLSGSGKSTVSALVAHRVGRSPGAVHLRSDVIRKSLAGVAATDRLPAEHYTPAASDAVYGALRSEAAAVLATGQSVIVDAVHARPDERAGAEAVARAAGVRFAGFWLDAPVDVLADRVADRRGDASDATPAVVRRQSAYDLGPIDWTRIDSTGGAEAAARRIAELITAPLEPSTEGDAPSVATPAKP